jgi:hypothetical protein
MQTFRRSAIHQIAAPHGERAPLARRRPRNEFKSSERARSEKITQKKAARRVLRHDILRRGMTQ